MVGIQQSSSTGRGRSLSSSSSVCNTATLLKILIVTLLFCISILTYLLTVRFPFTDTTSITTTSSSSSSSQSRHQLLEPKHVTTTGAAAAAAGMDAPTFRSNTVTKVVVDKCTEEYDRVMSHKTQGLTEEDFQRSRAWVGNEQRLANLARKLAKTKEASNDNNDVNVDPVNVIVAGGSITLGHGVEPVKGRYSDRLERWLNQMYPIHHHHNQQHGKKHRVYNRGSHGADMCAMAKRMEQNFAQILLENNGNDNIHEPDLVILEFAVNDYQGQDHKIHLDHKTDIFFDGFQEKATCAEAVVYRLIHKYPNTAILFLEFQTGILNRKTAQLLHIGVAQQYQIPVLSYAETMMPGYYNLLEQLKDYDYAVPVGNEILPFPHGCAPCLEEHIVTQFRPYGCKSICTFMERSGFKIKQDCKHPPSGFEPCMPAFWAHDAVHPSFVGHGIAMDLITHAIATTANKLCRNVPLSNHVLPPPSIHFLGSDTQLKSMTDWVMVQDTMDMFGAKDPLISTNHSAGFQNTGDGFAERQGWICTELNGGEYIEFDVDLPTTTKNNNNNGNGNDGDAACYVLYIASLKSYEGMGSYTVKVHDKMTKDSFEMDVDGIWKPQISVPADIAIKPMNHNANGQQQQQQSKTQTKNAGKCTGKCTVTVTTHDKKPNRQKNKVKIMTLSARTCHDGEF